MLTRIRRVLPMALAIQVPAPALTASACTAVSDPRVALQVRQDAPPTLIESTPAVYDPPRESWRVTGACAAKIRAASGGSVLLSDGRVFSLNQPFVMGNPSMVLDTTNSVFSSKPPHRSTTSRRKREPAVWSDAIDPWSSTDRRAAAWHVGTVSEVGFSDIDRVSGAIGKLVLLKIRGRVGSVYYQPGIDTNGGTLTVMIRDGKDTRVLWIDVSI
jgi:hypothetical protein